jgi:cytoskeleton protein RodZ
MRDDSIELNGPAESQPGPDVQPETGLEPEAEQQAEAQFQPFMRDKPDGETDPAGEAGWYLEREREARGLSLEEAGEAAGIHPYHLQAIELGDMTCMPERLEALEMIGAYAQFLGFDPEPLVEHYARFLPAPPLAAEPRHPANPGPLSSAKILAFGRIPKLPKFKLAGMRGGTGGLVAGLAGAMLLFAGLSYYLLAPTGGNPSQGQQQQADSGTPAPPLPDADPMPTASTGPDTAAISVGDQPMPEEEAPAGQQAQAGEDDLVGTGLDGITSLIEQTVPGVAAGGDAKALEGLASATDVAVTSQGREFGTGNGESRLTLKAKAPVWVRIEDAQGNVVMTQMLAKGDTYRVPNREGLVVIARDGGLLSYLIDGVEKGILGTPGEILVGRPLDLKSFEG